MTSETKKILVVDDIGEYSMVLEIYFPANAELISAQNIDEAKAAFDRETIALAVVDVRLNEKVASDASGMQLLSWIRETHPETPVIMISAYMGSEYEMEALERGAYCFLRKPLQPDQVREALTGALDA